MAQARDAFSATALTGRELSKAKAKAEEFARQKVVEAGDFSAKLGVPVRDTLLAMMLECRALCSLTRADERALQRFDQEQAGLRQSLARQRAANDADHRANSKRSPRA